MSSSLNPLAMRSLVTVAGDAISDYFKSILSVSPIIFIRGEYVSAHGFAYSILVFNHLIGAILSYGLSVVRRKKRVEMRVISGLFGNFILSIIGIVANFAVLITPPFLSWELFIAANPLVLPNTLVFQFRILVNSVTNFILLIFILLVIWFFVEEFTPGKNRVFDFDGLIENHLNESSNREQSSEKKRTLEESQIQSKLSEIENELK
jgi:hypothetical protein